MLAINPAFVDETAMTEDARRRGWTSFRATFRLEIAEALRSRWYASYAAVFFALTGLLLVFGLTESRVLGFTGLSRTLVTYTQLAMAIAPVYGAARGVTIPWREFVFDMGLLASLIFAFIGIGFLVSTLTRKVDTAQTLAFLIWLGLLLALDLILLGVLIRNQAPLETVVMIAMLNPLQVFRVASMMLFDPQLVLLGPTAYAIFDIFGRELFLVWAFLYPLALGALAAALGYWALKRSDLP